MDYLNLPFTQYDSAYLESLPDEVFFAKRFKLSKEDEALLGCAAHHAADGAHLQRGLHEQPADRQHHRGLPAGGSNLPDYCKFCEGCEGVSGRDEAGLI